MKLVIIEGIGKKETIEKYLGSDYRVFATGGHVRDLPKASLSVNVKNNFEPKYEILPDKKDVVKNLTGAAKSADEIYLATDPDREGEAISWHVANILGIDSQNPVRIVFNEISKKAVQNALKNARAIDIALVDAQQARRVLDRLVGYKISPVLCKKIQNRLSAGRVQSVTLRLIVEREREILNFVPEEYWPFFAILENKDKFSIKAALFSLSGKKIKLKNAEQVQAVVAALNGCNYVVDKIKKSVVKNKAPAPFITSTMQQDALNKLGMNLKQTTSVAQELYEGVEIPGEGKTALVTYIRTDSTRVSTDAISDARNFISVKYGSEYIPPKPNIFTSKKKNVQDAHEAIRPISIEKTPESLEKVLSRNHYRLYKLIYERFIASQMSDATFNSMTVDISAAEYGFRVTGKTPLFAGYTIIYKSYVDDKESEDESNVKLPDLKEGEILNFIEFKYEQKFTKPPSRYTDASLIKTMEDKGIGRPATYSPTVTLLSQRGYTEKDGKYIFPTPLGCDITDMLVKYFPNLFDVEFTADMENRLDEIEDGGKNWQKVVEGYYFDMEDKIAVALGDSFSLKKSDEESDVVCEKCGKKMLIKQGKYGSFLACPGYPKCKHTLPINGADSGGEKKGVLVEESGEVCEKCGKPMVVRKGRYGEFLSCSGYPQCKNSKNPDNKLAETDAQGENGEEACEKCGKPMLLKNGKFGKFFACSGYPQCKNIKNIATESENAQNQFCPKCGKPLKLIKGKNMFYGCTGYPECKFASSFPIAEGKCPECGSHLISIKNRDAEVVKCADKNCGYKKD